jgi:hypothetical protein
MATMTLREAAEHDAKTGQKAKLTGWGRVSKDRELRKVSRKARRAQRTAAAQENVQ